MAEEEVSAQCQRLAQAVALIMELECTAEARAQALLLCEEFKECPLCVPCGLKLAERAQPGIVRHFGLKALEHFARFRYSHYPAPHRAFLKKRVLLLVSVGTGPILEEEAHVKDAVARVVVELMKQDWPNDWPELIPELQRLNQKGETQAEMVMLILSRLFEDVLAFHTVPDERLSPIKLALLDRISTFWGMVRWHLKDSNLKTEPPFRRLMRATLTALAGIIDWMTIKQTLAQNCMVLKILWKYLDDCELQLEASECLLTAIDRIGGLTHSKTVMSLFKDDVVKYLFSPVQTSDGESLTDRRYFFLKRQCQLLCSLGKQLCRTMDVNTPMVLPSIFEKYLDALLCFTALDSQFVSSITQSTWQSFFNHKVLSRNPLLLATLPKYLRATWTNLIKVGFPSKNDSPSCVYARHDFSSDTDFCTFLETVRDEHKLLIEVACSLDHRTCFQIAGEFLQSHLSAVVDPGPMKAMTTDSISSTSPNSLIQWETMTVFVKVVMSAMFKVLSKNDILVKDGQELLKRLLNFKTKDPPVLAYVQILISTFLPFLNFNNEPLSPNPLSRFNEIIVEIKAAEEHSFEVRRGIFSRLLKLCQEKGLFILQDFEMIFNELVPLLCKEQLLLTQMEKNTLMEAIITVINQYKDYNRQKVFLEELIAPISSLWQSKEMQMGISETKAFITYVGADICITGNVKQSITDLNRSKIINFVSTILGMMRWTRCPSDLEEATAGGFVISLMPIGKPVFRNPCTEQVLKLLNDILVLISIQHSLYLPNVVSQMGNKFAKALYVLEVKNPSILDLSKPLMDTYDPSWNKTEDGFFFTLYQTCFCILGHAATSIKHEFYTKKDFVGQLLKYAFVHLENIPTHRLLVILCCFLKPLVHDCPPEYSETFLAPILCAYLTSLAKTLSNKWKIIDMGSIVKPASAAVKSPDSLKILANRLQVLTEEVMELITACCLSAKNPDTSAVAACSVSVGIADTRVVAVKPFETRTSDASHTVIDDGCVPNDDADNTIYTAESDDEGCVSIEDASASISTTESDTCCKSIANSNTSVGAVSDVACSQSKEDAYASVLTAESDDDSCAAMEETETSVHITAETKGPNHQTDSAMPEKTSVNDIVLDTCCKPDKNANPGVVAESSAADMPNSCHQESRSSIDGKMVVKELQPKSPLTRLGMCLMAVEDVCSALLITAFSSLVWTDRFTALKNPTNLCWFLLKQAIQGPPCAAVVTSCFTMVLKGLQKHRDHKYHILLDLAFQIYMSLRPDYFALKTVMTRVASVRESSLENFDDKLARTSLLHSDTLKQDFINLFAHIPGPPLKKRRKSSSSCEQTESNSSSLQEEF